MDDRFFRVFVIYPVLIGSLCIHEFSHAWVAVRRGDPTPRLRGRLSLNPLAHADVMGTIFLPLFCLFYGWPFIGWAKPVPVDTRYLKAGRRDMGWVALAGPVSNMILAAIATIVLALALRGFGDGGQAETLRLFEILHLTIYLNCMLAVFNCLPIPPLDGFMMLHAVVPAGAYIWLYRLSRLGLLLIIVLFFTGLFDTLVVIPTQVLDKFLVRLAVAMAGGP